jgi:hypothetical protein
LKLIIPSVVSPKSPLPFGFSGRHFVSISHRPRLYYMSRQSSSPWSCYFLCLISRYFSLFFVLRHPEWKYFPLRQTLNFEGGHPKNTDKRHDGNGDYNNNL